MLDSNANCFFLLDKMKYISSFKALYEFKKQYKKVGHSGTLDPYAEGLLVVGVNKALKFLRFLPKEKEYIFDITFGFSTNSDDLDGEIIEFRECIVTRDMIESALPWFVGKIRQVPSKFSALKVNGIRAYKLARANVDFDLNAREIEIFDLKLIDFSNDKARFSICCSNGTYVRSLARDICKYMNVIGCVSYLRRIRSDGFLLDGNCEGEKVDLNCMLKFYNSLILNDCSIFYLKNGVSIQYLVENENDIFAVMSEKQTFSGLVLYERGRIYPLYMI